MNIVPLCYTTANPRAALNTCSSMQLLSSIVKPGYQSNTPRASLDDSRAHSFIVYAHLWFKEPHLQPSIVFYEWMLFSTPNLFFWKAILFFSHPGWIPTYKQVITSILSLSSIVMRIWCLVKFLFDTKCNTELCIEGISCCTAVEMVCAWDLWMAGLRQAVSIVINCWSLLQVLSLSWLMLSSVLYWDDLSQYSFVPSG